MEKIDINIDPIIPKKHSDLMKDTEGLTKDIVNFINERENEYSTNAAALAFAVLYFLRTAREKDEKGAECIRSAILEIISEGR